MKSKLTDVKPVESYREPNYPYRSVLDEHPELLALVPKRWRTNQTVLTALGITCMLLTSCKNQEAAEVSRIAPVTDRNAFAEDKNKPIKTQRQLLQFDGTDEKKNISYEFISGDDFEAWENDSKPRASVYVYDIAGTAKSLRQQLIKSKPGGTYGVFYDPGMGRLDVTEKTGMKLTYSGSQADWQAQMNKMQTKAKDLAKEKLRKQVQDFVKWLKAQGVI